MLIGIIIGLGAAVCMVILYMVRNQKLTEVQKYYDAAHKILKEECLNNAIKNKSGSVCGGKKIMFYLSWKDDGKQGFVFNPEQGVRIGRIPEENEICVREETVSAHQCILYLASGRPAIQDCDSANGTWIKRGIFKHLVLEAEHLYSGDCIIVGSMKIKVKIFLFDMAYI